MAAALDELAAGVQRSPALAVLAHGDDEEGRGHEDERDARGHERPDLRHVADDPDYESDRQKGERGEQERAQVVGALPAEAGQIHLSEEGGEQDGESILRAG